MNMNINIDYEELIEFIKKQEDILYIPDHISNWLIEKKIDYVINDILFLIRTIADLDEDIKNQLKDKMVSSHNMTYNNVFIHTVTIPASEILNGNIHISLRYEVPGPVDHIKMNHEIVK